MIKQSWLFDQTNVDQAIAWSTNPDCLINKYVDQAIAWSNYPDCLINQYVDQTNVWSNILDCLIQKYVDQAIVWWTNRDWKKDCLIKKNVD